MEHDNRWTRYWNRCSTCGPNGGRGYGAVLWEQRTKQGTMVTVAYRCHCNAGMVNYPSLPPAPNQAPSGIYRALGDDED